MRAALLGLAFAAATSFAVAEKKEESDDPFDFDDEADGDDGDFDDSDTGYGKTPINQIKTTGVKRPLPEGVEPGSIVFEICTG